MLVLEKLHVDHLLSSLSSEECLSLLESLHGTLRQYSSPSNSLIQQPKREIIATADGHTTIFMPCSISTSTAIKIVTVSTEGVKGCVNLFVPNGELLAVVDADELTAIRTSLAVMIPFIRFPRPKTNVLVFVAGKQAEWHIRLALLLCKEVRHVTVINRSTPRQMESLFVTLRKSYPRVTFEILLKTASNFESRLRGHIAASDVLFCCTPTATPHFPYSYLGTGKPRFISLIGSYTPSMQEVDSEILLSGRVVYVDSKDACLAEAGELIRADVTRDQLVEIGELDAGIIPAIEGNFVFKCVGLAVMDFIMAQELVAMARRKGLGLDVSGV